MSGARLSGGAARPRSGCICTTACQPVRSCKRRKAGTQGLEMEPKLSYPTIDNAQRVLASQREETAYKQSELSTCSNYKRYVSSRQLCKDLNRCQCAVPASGPAVTGGSDWAWRTESLCAAWAGVSRHAEASKRRSALESLECHRPSRCQRQ